MTTKEVKLTQLDSVIISKEEIGKGSYGRVFKATTLCAVKEIHPMLVNDCTPEELAALKEKFLNECLHCSQLCHPNIVQFLGIYYPNKDVKLPWLVMEKMDCSLKQFLNTHKPTEVSFEVRMSILHDISLGLQYLHVQEIIHRDLSSNNVLLTKQMVAKIGDLGVAKVIDPTRFKTATRAPGTVTFMPPEALSHNPTYGKPVDVFSLGCVTIHIMTHKWPVPKDEIHIDKRTGRKSALSEIERREHYLGLIQPQQITDCIKQCLHELPDNRPTVSDICKVLQDLQPKFQLSKIQSILFKHYESHTSQDKPEATQNQPQASQDQPQTSQDQSQVSPDQPQASQDQPQTLQDQPQVSQDQPQTSQTIDKLERDTLLQKLKKLSQEQGRLLHVDRELTQAKKHKTELTKVVQQLQEMNQTKSEEHKKGKKYVALQQTVEHYKKLLEIAYQDLETKDDTISRYKAERDQYEAECEQLNQKLQKYKKRYSTSGKPEVKPKPPPVHQRANTFSQDDHNGMKWIEEDPKCQSLQVRSTTPPLSSSSRHT